MTKEEFFNIVQIKFGSKFKISDVPDIIKNKETTKITVNCPDHGKFVTSVRTFIESKYGCKKCAYESKSKEYVKTLETTVGIMYPNIDPIKNPIITTKDNIIATIYCFVNKHNNKIYVGKTIDYSYLNRWSAHKTTHGGCKYFYKAIKKYGWDGFDRYVLYQSEVLSNTKENKKQLLQIANDKERYYISLYKANERDCGYNLTIGGDGTIGYEFTNEVREKISKKCSGKNHWNYGKRNSAGVKVLQFDLNGKLIKKWDSIRDVQRAGIAKGCNVSECILGKTGSAGGYLWIRENEYNGEIPPEKLLMAAQKSNDKVILQYDLNGTFIKEYISAAEAARTFGCNSSTISGAANGKFDYSLGYVWIYKSEFSDELLKEKLDKANIKYKKSKHKVTTGGYNKKLQTSDNN